MDIYRLLIISSHAPNLNNNIGRISKTPPKILIHNTIPQESQDLIWWGLNSSQNSDIPLPHHLGQKPKLATVIAQQTVLSWQQLVLHRCTAIKWHACVYRHSIQINCSHFFAKIIQICWHTILKIWATHNRHLHPLLVFLHKLIDLSSKC